MPAAALTTGAVSILFALPAARVKGFYLALTTLAAQVVFPIVILGAADGRGSAGSSACRSSRCRRWER